MRNLSPRQSRWVRFRIGLLVAVLLTGAAVVARRAYQLQVEGGERLRAMAEEQYLRDIKLAPKRGTIFDRHGAELAISVDVDSAWANPRELRANGMDPGRAAQSLATVLDVDPVTVARRLKSDRYFVWIKRRLTPRQAADVRALSLPGVHMQKEARRYYPNRELAAHVLGFANVDGRGIEGLELSLDDSLTGSVDTVPAIRDRRGHVVFSEQLLDDRGTQGDDVYLTLDKTVQHIAERELELAVRTFEARAGSIVVMEPGTGEILALANHPTFNPNDPGRFDASMRRNRAVTDHFEPGSTIKPFTVAGALAAGSVRSDRPIDCENGAMEVGDDVIHDSHPFGMLTPSEILAHSSNIGTAKIGASMGRGGLFRTLRRFGFGESTALPLPGESRGLLRHYRHWYEMDAATIAFGQGMSVTNVQLATAMSALANGGRLMRPVLVRRVVDGEGEVRSVDQARVTRRVVPAGVARLVGGMLTAVTGPDGTGGEAAIEGYLVAGKTGTAQKADYRRGGYARGKWLASFVGFAPARDPRLVISVVIDEPYVAYAGGAVAAPVFRRVGQAALAHLGLVGDEGGQALAAHRRERQVRLRENRRARRELARSADSTSGADRNEQVTPSDADADGVPVPDLEGHSARVALHSLHRAGLDARIRGTGLVVRQEPPADAVVALGSEVGVELEPPYRESSAAVPTLAAAETGAVER